MLPAAEVYCFAGQHRQDIDQGGANLHALLTLYASTCKSSSKLRQAEQERDYALSHQKKVEVPVEKPVLYQKCQNCNQTAYLRAKEKYDMQRETGICSNQVVYERLAGYKELLLKLQTDR